MGKVQLDHKKRPPIPVEKDRGSPKLFHWFDHKKGYIVMKYL